MKQERENAVMASEYQKLSDVWNGLPGEELALADATPPIDRAIPGVSLEHRLDPLIEARLADVVRRLRATWINHISGFWGDIHPIHKDAVSNIDQRVATALRQGFFQFSQLLCGLELLLLQSKQLGVVTEQSVLSLEQLLVELGNNRCHLVEVSNADRGLPEVFSSCQGGDCDTNK